MIVFIVVRFLSILIFKHLVAHSGFYIWEFIENIMCYMKIHYTHEH